MKINKSVVIAIVLFGLLLGSLGAGVLLSQRPLSVNAAPPAQQETNEAGDVEDDDSDEANVSPDQAGITADEARVAAEAAYPEAKAVAVELERENGQLIYEVELDNRLEVIVDAADGAILGTERDAD